MPSVGALNSSSFFPRAVAYPGRRQPPGRVVRESADGDTGFAYSERHLQCVWYDASWRPPRLRTSAGEEVIVEDPGRWNLEAGPDFLNAVLTIGPERRHVCGDVEIHVRPADWHAHGHADDPAYSRIVAHVCFFPGALPPDSLPRGAVQVALRDGLKANPAFSFDSVDLTAYPYACRPATVPPCAKILATWSPRDRAALLDSAGEERLRVKACRLESAIKEQGADRAFYEECMCALGYKHNRVPFRRLASVVTLDALRQESDGDIDRAYALLLGAAGLLPAKTSSRWDAESRAFVRSLWDHWWKLQSRWESRCLPPGSWRLSGLRPANHPARRLAAAAALFGGKTDALAELRALDTSDPEAWFAAASSWLEKPTMKYWEHRFSIGGERQKATVALLGEGRMAALLSNVVIPSLAAAGVNVTPLLNHLPAEEDNALVRQTAFALFGRDHNPLLHQTGLRRQGLLQIFHDFCLNTRSACRDCALALQLDHHDLRPAEQSER